MKLVTAKVINNIHILPELKRHHGKSSQETRLIWLTCPDIAAEVRPGQFVMVHCGDACMLPRPFSIFRTYGNSDIAIFYTVWENGKGTEWLANRRPGDIVEIFGPLGNGFIIQPDAKNLLMVAGGIGIAPIFFLAQDATVRGYKITLLYGTANLSRYPIPPEIRTLHATEDGSFGYKGNVTDLIPNYANIVDQVFACGPLAMYRDFISRRHELGLDTKPVQVSLEARMGCGVGVCYGCTVRTGHGLKQICKDGPVFELSDVAWDDLII